MIRRIIVHMTLESHALHDFEERAAKAIARRKLQIGTQDLIRLLTDLGETSPPVSGPDRDFLVEYAGLTDAELSDEALAGIDATIGANRARASVEVQNESMTTQEVAQLLGMAPANVRRTVTEGALYSVKPTPSSHHRFPKWQFVDNRPLPGLREVIGALPEDYHPIEVAQFMLEPTDALRSMSPYQWLSEGGRVVDVVHLADGRSWE